MVRVLELINSIESTSIPYELSIQIAEKTDAEVVVASFYDNSVTDVECIEDTTDLPIEIKTLDATSRFDRSAWKKFRKELQRDYDLLHTHHNFSGSVARLIAALEDIPSVNTEHRDHQSYSLLQNIVNAPTLPLAERIISNSHVTQNSFQWYERLLLDHEQLQVVHNGVDLEHINRVVSNPPNDDTDEAFRVCTVGRMIPVKNQSTLVQAFPSIIDQYPQSELILIGDGPLRSELESTARSLGISDRVQFTGTVSRSDVYDYFGNCDVFVIPSLAEGFCVAAVEAMAAGLPVVASDIPVFHEVIGEPGLFVNPDDPDAFANKLESLLRNVSYREEKGEACRRRAHRKFSLDDVAKDYYEIYKSVCNYD